MFVFIGFKVDIYKTEQTREYLLNADNIIKEYKIVNNLQDLSETNFDYTLLPDGVRIYFYEIEGEYQLTYRDGILYGGSNDVGFRPRP